MAAASDPDETAAPGHLTHPGDRTNPSGPVSRLHGTIGRAPSPTMPEHPPILIQRLRDDAIVPTRAHPTDAGLDLAVPEPVTVEPDALTTVDTGIAVAVPAGWVGLIAPRSSAGTHLRLRLANTVGVIDSDYRGSIKLPLVTDRDDPVHLDAGHRVAQLVIVPCHLGEPVVVDTLDGTARGTGGFGSTGT